MRSLSPCVRWMQLLPAVFVIIGCEDRTPTRWERISAPKYSVATGSGTWTARASMPTARERLGAAAINGILYAVGGQNAGPGNLTTVEAYDPATDRWTTKASMPTGRSHLGVAAINGILYAVGGVADIGSVPTVEAYDPATDTWTTKASMHTARFGLGVAAINGILYAVGGDPRGQPSGVDAATVEAYDPASDTWTAQATMPIARG